MTTAATQCTLCVWMCGRAIAQRGGDTSSDVCRAHVWPVTKFCRARVWVCARLQFVTDARPRSERAREELAQRRAAWRWRRFSRQTRGTTVHHTTTVIARVFFSVSRLISVHRKHRTRLLYYTVCPLSYGI